ncbi:MAG: hypothetical protein M3069_30410 [Chloroflexota bacterium]|nr:hypothetical protein [Chloroflexota bacterium]
MTVKEDLHHLVDKLDDDDAREALARLQDLRLPRILREAPIDDERESEAERVAVAEAEVAIVRGDVIRDEDLEHELRRG